ncbi:endosomal transmembrane epsin interactor 1, partial [Accipiter gentilis]|uniref:endosomal transmembrane epsin interactor 1 n=1 Tax=Astur gentilis TaxID=8957 RepID=UPI00210F4F87
AAAAALGAKLVPVRRLVFLGLLQVILCGCLVVLNFGALWLTTTSQVKNACSVWAGFWVIVSGILGLLTWKKPIVLLANLFSLLSIISVLLNLAGLILSCQGIQFVSSVPKCDLVDVGEKRVCYCCEDFNVTECIEDTALKLYHLRPCSAAHFHLKKVLFALCALYAVTTAVCLIAAALCYLLVFATGRSCPDECHVEDQGHILDPDDPPPYFATFYPCTTQRTCRMLASNVILLPHIYRSRIKGTEESCPQDPPPPYEAVQRQNSSEQEGVLRVSVMEIVDSGEGSHRQASQGEEIPESSSRVSLSPSNASLVPAGVSRRAFNQLWKWSESDSELCYWFLQGAVLSCEAATQAKLKLELCTVILQKSLRPRALAVTVFEIQCLIDNKIYTYVKQLVAQNLKQSSSSMSLDIRELVENTKSLLKSDEKHMAKAITSATFFEQVMASAEQAMSLCTRVLPFRQHRGLLYLESCGDMNTFTADED